LADKDIAIQEMSKTVSRLKSRGIDANGLFYGYRDNVVEDPGKVLWKPEDAFVKVFPEELARVATKLSGTETIITMMLMAYISYDSGMLTKGGGYPLTHDDIQRITGYLKKAVIVNMDKLVKKKVFSRNRVGHAYQYFANPYIFFRGKYINNTLVDMFKSYKQGKNES